MALQLRVAGQTTTASVMVFAGDTYTSGEARAQIPPGQLLSAPKYAGTVNPPTLYQVMHHNISFHILVGNWETITNRCTENPGGGKGLGICSSNLFSCDYQTCDQQNFSISDLPNIKLVFRDDQLATLGLQPSASTAETTASNALAASATQHTTSLPSLLLPSSTHTAAPPEWADHKTVIAVGLGIGVPLGLCALAGLVMLLFARKKIKKLTNEKQQAEADLLAYKKAREIHDQQFPRIYEAPPPDTELDVGRDYHQLHS